MRRAPLASFIIFLLFAGSVWQAFPTRASATFETAVNYTVGDNPLTMVVADLDSDGIPDLVTANFWSTNISILFGNGDGTFAPVVAYQTGTSPRIDFAADLDGDGDVDLAVGNQSTHNISILLNNGDGTFAAAVNYAAGTHPFYPVEGDLDGDGDVDLITTNYTSDNISVFLNNGDGTFAAAVNYAVGDTPRPMTIADLDGDGDRDLAVVNNASDSLSVLMNNGDGTFVAAVNYAVGDQPSDVVGSDLDGDGDRDLIIPNAASDSLSVLMNNGDGTFVAAVNYAVGTAPLNILIDDLDRDGNEDAMVSNYYSNNISILLGNGDGTFVAAVNYAVGTRPSHLVDGDLDGDGDPDIVSANQFDDSISILFNNGDGTFSAPINYATGDGPQGVAIADLDRDGDTDLISHASLSDTISVLLNTLASTPGGGVPQPSLIPAEIEVSILPDRCTTDRSVQLLLYAQNTAEVKIGNLPDVSDGIWRPFSPGTDLTQAFNWMLSEGDGEKTVYVVFKGPFFDLTSPIHSATVRLDETTLCQSAQQHAHIVDLEGHVMPAQTNPECRSDFAHATVAPYIMTSDGLTRGWRDLYVKVTSTSTAPGVTTYAFEDGDDFAYDDALVTVERLDRSVNVRVESNTGLNISEIRLRVDAADRGTVDDHLLWLAGVDMDSTSMSFNLGSYRELCESDLVPHPHPGVLFRSPSSDVYYMGRDGKRHAFPNADIFKSWFGDDAPVMTVATYQLSRADLGENVTLKPGSLARISGETPLYVVDLGQVLHEILSKTFLVILQSPPWSDLIYSLSPGLVENYLLAEPILSESEPIPPAISRPIVIDDLWPVATGVDEAGPVHATRVLDGRVEFEGTPYPTGDVELRFRIFDKDGHAFTAEDLNVVHDKRIHLIIIRDDLAHNDFQHIHPEEQNGLWSVAANFKESGEYLVYVDIAPTGQVPVILRSSLVIGEDPQHRHDLPGPDPFYAYFDNPFRLELLTKALTAGQDLTLSFQLTKDGLAFTDIRTWLNAFGHLVILEHQNSNTYLHTHAARVPDNGLLTFRARFPYPGRYTLFVQLDAEGTLRTFPITVDVRAP
jgi:hypothetical protein